MTAVGWFRDQLEFDESVSIDNIEDLLEQAKEIDKEQKHAEYMRGWKDGYVKNETYKNTKE